MALFAKLDTAIHRNPKVRRAGPDAREVFVFLLCVNREHAFDGNIPPAYSSAEYIAHELQRRPSKVRAGLEACIRENLLKAVVYPSNDGKEPPNSVVGVRFAGWDDSWRTIADDSRRRVAAFRAKQAEAKEAVTACNGVTAVEIEQSRERSSPVPGQPSFDLDGVYRDYPRHEGKTRGMKKLKPQIRTQDDFDALRRALANYKAAKQVREGFVKHFDTWVGCWRDYLEDPRDGKPAEAVSDLDRRVLAAEEARRNRSGA